MAYADDVNLIGNDIKNQKVNLLLNACKEIDLAINIRKTKYMKERRYRA